jgi:putative sigma-54 modulation protein
MEITIRGNNYRVGEAMEEYTTKKLARLNRFLPNITEIHVDLTQQVSRRGEDRAIAQITVRHARGAIIRAEESASGDNMQSALTQALENMYRRIERFKNKRSRKGRTRFSMSVEELAQAEAIPDLVDEGVIEEEEEEAGINVVRRKTVSLVAMNEQEAIEQMELLGHSFFMFFNEAIGSVNVVYKRRSGGYGVLIPAVE